MASLVLLFSELVRNHDQWDAAALLSAYPSSNFTLTTSCALTKPSKDHQTDTNSKTQHTLLDNPMDSMVSLDFVLWP
uniref:Uncharacterized protein n=1 Tax=Cajanus cajan TaxID=3821 RepID=A0A151U058_CAJCA|nr:hypothetical protein KK1_005312 [Cajanus cajan]